MRLTLFTMETTISAQISLLSIFVECIIISSSVLFNLSSDHSEDVFPTKIVYIFCFVRSNCLADFSIVLNALAEFCTWFTKSMI